MAPSTIFCVICKKSSKPIKKFTASTLSKCAEVLVIRKQHNLKFSDVDFLIFIAITQKLREIQKNVKRLIL